MKCDGVPSNIYPYAAIRALLLNYYGEFARKLPWRETQDPYRIWVSEIMLQQTQVETVIPRYHAFLAQFPSLQALGEARLERVLEAWAGLGYYRRARLLHQGAQYVLTEAQGQIPQTLTGLLRLPGVGRYTAGAIGSIAFGLPVPIVDGNVARVVARFFCVNEAMDTRTGEAELWAHAQNLVCTRDPGALNQALMELGALICRPIAPKCLLCPVRPLCTAYQRGEVDQYPRKKQPAAIQPLRMAMALIRRGEKVLLKRRPLNGKWAGLWEMPSCEGPDAKAQLERELGTRLGAPRTQVTHRLTHRLITAELFEVSAQAARRLIVTPLPTEWRLTTAPEQEPLSGLARKALLAYRDAKNTKLRSTEA